MSRWNKTLLIADDFVSLLFPRLCHACDQPLVRNEKHICTACQLDIPVTGYHLNRENRLEKSFYGRCYIEKAAAWSYYRQGGKAQKLIHKIKYNGVKPLGKYLGQIYGRILADSGFCDDVDVLIPVPLHRKKLKRRGFNQSELIAGGISSTCKVPLENKALVRVKSSETQTSKHRYDRWVNVQGIFGIKNKEVIVGKHVMLVDDVITTGSTIEACATELLNIPGVKVSVIALAAAER